MSSTGIAFHHPLSFWLGCLGITLDVHFHVADSIPLNREHGRLVIVLLVTVTIDIMRSATLGVVMPGMTREYEITSQVAGVLALVALTGTTIGSIAWGRLADLLGRGAAIVLSARMFIGTAICGAMPSFNRNLVMCFLMGLSARGLLVIFLNRYIPESPRYLASKGLKRKARYVLARSALFALPGIVAVIWLYHHWSSVRTLMLFIALTTLSLGLFVALGHLGTRSVVAYSAAILLLLVSSSGVIAMLISHAAEIYPVHLRGTGAGLAAASSKLGSILGALLGILGLFDWLSLSALVTALPLMVAVVLLGRSGVDTRGQRLEDIHAVMNGRTQSP